MSGPRLIDGQVVRTRRLQLGLSQRRLASAAGISLATLTDIENHDGQDRSVTVASLRRLAEALDLTPARLVEVVAVDEPTEPEPVAEDAQPDDVPLVARLLLDATAALHVDDIAHALGWSYRRADDALDRLDGHLSGTGLHVQLVSGRALLRPQAGTDTAAALIAPVLAARRGIDRGQAALLHTTVRSLQETGRASGHGQRGMASLLLTGLLEDDGGRRVRLGDDLRYALDL